MQKPIRRRAVLVAPGSDERKVRGALRSSADEVVLDLEDSVTLAHKNLARETVFRILREFDGTRAVSVRINALGTAHARSDLETCARLGTRLTSIVVPKTESARDLLAVDGVLAGAEIGLQALVETPLGVQNITAITRSATRLESVVLGYADLGAALGRSRSARPEHWLSVQESVLIAARAVGVQAIDGPFLGITDGPEFTHSGSWARDLGFDGKWVIHPSQINSATAIFTPSESSVDEARRVLDALEEAERSGHGAAQLDGQMLDEAVAVAARRVLNQVGGR